MPRASPPTEPLVTPWRTEGRIDHERLQREFGLDSLGPGMLQRIEALAGDLHPLLRRGFYFAHRSLEAILDAAEAGDRFALYTGRGPSGPVHLGHLVPWTVARWLQERLGVEVYFQLTDDEKHLFREGLPLEETNRWAYDNALDFLALGFEAGKTWILVDTDHAGLLYPQAVRVAKRITLSAARASFGFGPEANVGQLFFPCLQAVPALLPSLIAGSPVPCLILHGLDQDPHVRLARDALPRLGYPKPSSLVSRLAPGLDPSSGKMSASDPARAIFAADGPEAVLRKIERHAFSGGRATAAEHRRFGGTPETDASFAWLTLLEPSDERLAGIEQEYRAGRMLSGDLKQRFARAANRFLAAHREARSRLEGRIPEFIFPQGYRGPADPRRRAGGGPVQQGTDPPS